MSRCADWSWLEFDKRVLTISQILHQDIVRFAEVKFFFIKVFGGVPNGFAIVSLYSPPNEHLLRLSHNTLIVCGYQGEQDLIVIPIESIISVVAMIPFRSITGSCYMVEKIGLDVVDTDHRDDNDEE